ncbi:hypothetical protein OEV98_05870 [Caldibacillus lycopersici]|uniref:Uncharacterized protein n=1 Tax=Perspicuibacillus lycopersici TaxID=1325689 RepID=A0AAE3LMM3_9BACI|nr:hypothetical protein [Perspicuibacillus lycopersici]MCU9613076.1 hypothetical protein [Perspicuibacillus lycopersici]
MYAQTGRKSNSKNRTSDVDNKELIAQLEKDVSVAIWIQAIGKVMEVIYLTKLLLIDEDASADQNERQVVEGVWIQTIGQIIEAISVTNQLLARTDPIRLSATSAANIGDWLQGIGSIYEAYAGRQIITKEKEALFSNILVP